MDIRQLRTFAAIARLGSFTKAAEELHVAQPAVSMAIRKLEEELELTLFSRQDRKVALTAEGEVLLQHAKRLLGDLGEAQQEMADLRGLAKGEVRVGIPPMMSSYFFPDIIGDFARRYPQLQLSVLGEGAWRIQRLLGQGELDVGVIAGGQLPENLECRHFLREEVVVCLPADHPLAVRPALSFAEVIRQPLVFFKEGYYLRELIFDRLRHLALKPRIVFETNLFTLIKSLVKGGLGISIFMRMVVADDPELVAVPFDPPLHLDLALAWNGSYLSRANRAFVEFLLERTRDFRPQPDDAPGPA